MWSTSSLHRSCSVQYGCMLHGTYLEVHDARDAKTIRCSKAISTTVQRPLLRLLMIAADLLRWRHRSLRAGEALVNFMFAIGGCQWHSCTSHAHYTIQHRRREDKDAPSLCKEHTHWKIERGVVLCAIPGVRRSRICW